MSRPANNRLGARPMCDWFPANQGFYVAFRHWLEAGGYSDSALRLYGAGARLALGSLDKAYWLIDPKDDLDLVRQAILDTYPNDPTRSAYFKGLAKLGEYLRFRCHRPAPEKQVNWPYFLDPLPEVLAEDVRAYVTHRRRTWLPDEIYRATCTTLSHLTRSLRWMAVHGSTSPGQENKLTGIEDFPLRFATGTGVTPELWWEYVDHRLASGIKAITINGELRELGHFLHFLEDQGRAICQRMLRVEPLAEGTHLPRDVPMDQLRRLLAEIEAEAAATHPRNRRMGILDRAWFLLMLHSGLRTGEVRRLQKSDMDLKGGRVRIEQSKGLKDRVVYLSPATVVAIEAYFDVRGPAADDHLLLYRHEPLSVSYCSHRLRTYSKRCGVLITPHQLRFSCATLLLNAGAPVLTVQSILGHKFIDTTLGYARLPLGDGTVAADYYRAMAEIETRFEGDRHESALPESGQLLALVDALHAGTLNDAQRETVQALRAGILAMTEGGNGSARPKAT